MHWSVPDNASDPTTGSPSEAGALIHEDLLISASLCSLLDDQTWGLAHSEFLPAIDPLSDLNDVY